MNIQFFFQFHSKLEKYFCKHRIVIIRTCTACKKGMDAEMFRSLFLEHTESVPKLCFCHTVFCILWVIHNVITDLEYTTGVIPAAYGFRNFRQLFKKRDMGNIVKIDNRTQLCRKNKILRRRYVGGKHDIMPLLPNCLRHDKLGIRRAV